MKLYSVMSEEDSCPGGVQTLQTPQSMTTCKTLLRIRISWYNLLQLITLKHSHMWERWFMSLRISWYNLLQLITLKHSHMWERWLISLRISWYNLSQLITLKHSPMWERWFMSLKISWYILQLIKLKHSHMWERWFMSFKHQLVQLITTNYTQTFTHVGKMVHVTSASAGTTYYS